jgi:hypothetical protein
MIANWYAGNPGRRGLLRLAAAISVGGHRPRIVVTPQQIDKLSDHEDVTAAILLLLYDFSVSQIDAEIAFSMLSSAKIDLGKVIDMMNNIRISDGQEAMLLSLYNSSKKELTAETDDQLKRIIMRSLRLRTSHLNEPATWAKLQLPASLRANLST